MANPERRRATYSDLLQVPENLVGELIDGHGDALVPDLAGWLRERMPEVPQDAAIELAPDWVCEVLSPSTQSHDRVKKMGVYARERVAHVWLVDPLAQTSRSTPGPSAHGCASRWRRQPRTCGPRHWTRWSSSWRLSGNARSSSSSVVGPAALAFRRAFRWTSTQPTL